MHKLRILIGGASLLASALAAHAAGDIEAGKAAASQCTSCHGSDGRGTAGNPGLAGKSPEELVQSLVEYKTGQRAHPMMVMVAKGLDEKKMEDLAAYFSSLTP